MKIYLHGKIAPLVVRFNFLRFKGIYIQLFTFLTLLSLRLSFFFVMRKEKLSCKQLQQSLSCAKRSCKTFSLCNQNGTSFWKTFYYTVKKNIKHLFSHTLHSSFNFITNTTPPPSSIHHIRTHLRIRMRWTRPPLPLPTPTTPNLLIQLINLTGTHTTRDWKL